MANKINVTKVFLPPQREYLNYLNKAWANGWITNNGELVRDLEKRLNKHLGTKNVYYVSSGTTALQIAIKSLELKGEIITTPFSYVATTSSIVWEGCKPVYADINPKTLNIDPHKIEKLITSKTSGILATHVFGNPCDIETIKEIAQKHNLKVIYDAAHCFGTLYKSKSVFCCGDISITSFHATKVFHTVEGGALFTNNVDTGEKIRTMRNFGHSGEESFAGLGINGKNSELHAAMGLTNLRHIEKILKSRKQQSYEYDKLLEGINAQKPKVNVDSKSNYSYYPLIFKNEETCLTVKKALESNNIYPRRYFSPSLSTLEYVERQHTPVSDSVASRILCLPLYFGLTKENQKLISSVIRKVQMGS